MRNPLLALEAAKSVATLPPEARAALRSLLLAIRADAQVRAEKCWRTHKAPMAAYWKAVAVYAGHASRLCRELPPGTLERENDVDGCCAGPTPEGCGSSSPNVERERPNSRDGRERPALEFLAGGTSE